MLLWTYNHAIGPGNCSNKACAWVSTTRSHSRFKADA
jgi:hypothetical protein